MSAAAGDICAQCTHFKMEEYPEHARVGLGRCFGYDATFTPLLNPFHAWSTKACRRFSQDWAGRAAPRRGSTNRRRRPNNRHKGEMTEERMKANHRLAELLGWTDLFEVPGAILGAPPAGQPARRNQGAVPDWAGDWRACGLLLAAYRMDLASTSLDAVARCRSFESPPGVAAFADFDTEDAAVRAAIVAAVVAKLEAGQQ